MKRTSRTKAAPYKETPHHRSPSESIANNYSPAAQDLKIKELSRCNVDARAYPVSMIQDFMPKKLKASKDHSKV